MPLKDVNSLNALSNPCQAGDVVRMDDGSLWPITQDMTEWVIVPPQDSSLPRLRCFAQIDLIRYLVTINEQRGSDPMHAPRLALAA